MRLVERFDNPAVTRRVAGAAILLSALEWCAATVFGWVNSVAYVSHLSQLAITISLIPWWQGARIEKRQAEEDIPHEVTQKLVEATTLERVDGQP